MSGKKNIELVQSMYAALLQGDMAKLFSHITEKTRIVEAPSLVYGGVYQGPVEIAQFLTKLSQAVSNMQIQVKKVVEAGEYVLGILEFSGVNNLTGQAFSIPALELWEIQGAEIIEIRPFYFDTAILAQPTPSLAAR